MNICYRVELSETERSELQALLSGGKQAARTLKRAQILVAADSGIPDEDIARSVAVGGSTVYRTKRRFVEGNLERALREEPRPGAARKLSGPEEALLVATGCAKPPAGRARVVADDRHDLSRTKSSTHARTSFETATAARTTETAVRTAARVRAIFNSVIINTPTKNPPGEGGV
jgi:transposase